MRGVAAVCVAAVALGAGASSSSAADECRGLQVCIPVAGPWVVIPPPQRTATARWRLVCPQGVVGGVDALASEAAVAVEFPGRIGSPVNPGITTTGTLVFTGAYAGRVRRRTSYEPFIGCIPGAGGGARTPMALDAVKPGDPITTRVATLQVAVGRTVRATVRCKRGERLLSSTHSVGLYTPDAPTKAQLAAVRVIAARRGGAILVGVTRRGLAPDVRAEVQVLTECAR